MRFIVFLLLHNVICKVTHDFGGHWPSGMDEKMHKENKSHEVRAAFCFFPGPLELPSPPLPKPKQLSRRKQLIIAVITKSVGCYNYISRRSGRRRSKLRWWWRTRMIEDLELAVIGSHGYE